MQVHKQYLDPNTPAQNVYGLHLPVVKRNNNNMHTHNYHEFMLVLSGSILHKFNNESEVLTEHQLCFIRANDIHSISTYANDKSFLFNIGIPTALFDKVIDFYDIDSTFLFSSKKPITVSLSIKDYTNLIRKIDNFSKIDYGELHGKLFKNLLAELIFLLITPNKSGASITYLPYTPNWILQLIAQMKQPEYFIEGLPKLLSLTNYSQEYLTRSFRKYLNLTPTQYINSLRLSYAKKLIIEDNVPIVDACYKSGFNCEGYFYKEFKKMFSMTPRQMLKVKENTI